jgi:hypothetical protein
MTVKSRAYSGMAIVVPPALEALEEVPLVHVGRISGTSAHATPSSVWTLAAGNWDTPRKATTPCQAEYTRPKPVREVSAMCMQARLWDFGPWYYGYCFGGRPSRRERTEELKDYIAELKEALEEAEERLKELEK